MKNLLIILTILISVFSCKKKVELPVYKFQNNIRDFFVYKIGDTLTFVDNNNIEKKYLVTESENYLKNQIDNAFFISNEYITEIQVYRFVSINNSNSSQIRFQQGKSSVSIEIVWDNYPVYFVDKSFKKVSLKNRIYENCMVGIYDTQCQIPPKDTLIMASKEGVLYIKKCDGTYLLKK